MKIDARPALTLRRAAVDLAIAQRTAVVAAAALILFIRFRSTFTAPQFWAEDGILISAAYNHGAASLFEPIGGAYFNSFGSLVAFATVHLSASAWPWITTYAAHLAALFVVFIVMSPRFDIPLKPIAALAVVATPIQDNVFGGLANAQWILPLALFVLAFCRRHPSRAVLYAEITMVIVIGLDGPLGCFLVPIYALRAALTSGEDRKRLIALGIVVLADATVQIVSIALHLGVFNLAEPMPYDPWLWLTMPLRWFDAIRLAGIFVHSMAAPAVAFGVIAAAIWFAAQQPYKHLKLAMLFFAAVILYSGMIKFRHGLYMFTNDRYVYVGSVFSFWFVCLMADYVNPTRRKFVTTFAIAMVVVSTGRRIAESRPAPPVPWALQSHLVGHGPVSLPIAPGGPWAVELSH